MKYLKKAFFIVFALVLCLGTPGMVSVHAAGTQTSIGTAVTALKLGSITAYLDYGTGVLTLSGKGALSAKNGKKLDQYKYDVKKVVIEEGITSIKGFGNAWPKLTTVILPNSLKRIGSCDENGLCLSGCSNLKTVRGGKNLTFVGKASAVTDQDYAFSDSKWEAAGRKKGKLLLGKVLYCYTKSSKKVTASYTQILPGAFKGNTAVQAVNISGIKYLGESVFQNCTSLKSVTLSGSITTLPRGTFKGCKIQTLRGASGSAVQKYAKAHEITFRKIK